MHWITEHIHHIAPLVGGSLGLLAAILAYFSPKSKSTGTPIPKFVVGVAIVIGIAGWIMVGIVAGHNYGS